MKKNRPNNGAVFIYIPTPFPLPVYAGLYGRYALNFRLPELKRPRTNPHEFIVLVCCTCRTVVYDSTQPYKTSAQC